MICFLFRPYHSGWISGVSLCEFTMKNHHGVSATISQLESEAGKTGTSDSASSPEPCSTFTSRVISDVFDYINAHYLENISLADIAESFF